MPTEDGWHIHAFSGPNGLPLRWHYCEGAPHDTLVPDTATARREHETACRQRLAELRTAEAEEARLQQVEALALFREEKRTELQMRNDAIGADYESGELTLSELAENYGLKVATVKKMLKVAA
jgi:hypothetical protein